MNLPTDLPTTFQHPSNGEVFQPSSLEGLETPCWMEDGRGWKLVAARDAFGLFDRGKPNGCWQHFKLVYARSDLPKRNWWLAWNGERLAHNRDAGLLAEHQPDVYDWVVAVLAGSSP